MRNFSALIIDSEQKGEQLLAHALARVYSRAHLLDANEVQQVRLCLHDCVQELIDFMPSVTSAVLPVHRLLLTRPWHNVLFSREEVMPSPVVAALEGELAIVQEEGAVPLEEHRQGMQQTICVLCKARAVQLHDRAWLHPVC